MNAIIPVPKIDVSVRDATLGDLAFIDSLQKSCGDNVGFMRTSWIEPKITGGQVIVAEDGAGTPVGYCMGTDRYFKRDDVGIIYQMNVVPGRQRGFVGATLLKAMFERSAYGCRLFSCWCAQDIKANYFWEAMGFAPLAFRAGSEKKARVHIFWQKRIREGDVSTPFWFPAQTTGGAMRSDRLVLPIPAGTHWSAVMPIVLPGMEREESAKAIEGPKVKASRKVEAAPAPKPVSKLRALGAPRMVSAEPIPAPKAEKPKRGKVAKPKVKNDPKLIAAARELRDRWLEHVNDGGAKMIEDAGKYDVSRALPGLSAVEGPEVTTRPTLLLPAA